MPLYGQKQKQYSIINHSKPRVDGVDKVTGRAQFAADLYYERMVYGGMLRSPYACADIVSISTDKAKAIPGVLAVLTASDLRKTQSWAMYRYLTDRVRYVGDVVALVCAESKDLVQAALQSIEVEYKERPGVFTMREALAEGAPQIHENFPGNKFTPSEFHIEKGNINEGFAKADFILEREYETQYVEHAYIETEAVLAVEDPADGLMTVHASAQNPFFTRRYVADILGLPMNQVRVVQETLGGSFGGKEEGVGLLAARAALLCQLVKRPVKMVFSREESFVESAKRHPFILRYKAGVTKDGHIVAWEGSQIDNSGAYNNQTQFMNWRANVHSCGAYSIPNVKTETFGVFTNNIHSGAFRGYSSPALLFGQEQFIDELAEEIGMDEVEFRRINCLKDGLTNATGMVLDNVILQEVMDHTVAQSDYTAKRKQYSAQPPSALQKGIGMAISHRSCGLGAEAPDASGAMVIANEDGSVHINTGLAENGQGLKTAYAQIAAEALGVCYESVIMYGTNTHAIADSGMTVASRGTVMGAQSMRKAATKLNQIMRENAVALGFFNDTSAIEEACKLSKGSLDGLSITADDLILKDSLFFHPAYKQYTVGFDCVCGAGLWSGCQMASYEWFKPDNYDQDHHTGQGTAGPNFAYSCVVAEVEVDMGTGYVDLLKVTAGHDVGTAINPALISGQVYGGIVMGQGYGIMEDVELSRGRVLNRNLDEYILPTSMDMPEMQINIFECDDEKGTFGAKSVGEPATEAVAAAIANAVYNATKRRVRINPAGLEQVLLGKKLIKG